MATTTQGEAAMKNIDEIVATMLCHLASKMPYCADEDAQRDWTYLTNRYTTKQVIAYTGLRSWQDLLDRAITIRAAAENAVTFQEVAA
jgi:hypothetical protein